MTITRNAFGKFVAVPVEERFWEHVDKTSSPNGCWVWVGTKNPAGYGIIKPSYVVTKLAHRIAWEITNGPIPAGYSVCHKCDNPPCVNPDHLFLGTDKDNADDKTRKGRGTRGQKRPGVTGENHPMAKLTSEQVLEIRHERATDNTSLMNIAKKYGVSKRTIQKIVHFEIWKSV